MDLRKNESSAPGMDYINKAGEITKSLKNMIFQLIHFEMIQRT